MNSEQAKFILRGYRPNGADAADVTFGEALAQARNDPALHEWLAREQSFDAAISTKLGEVSAPAGLREGILAGARVTVSGNSRRNWWQQPVWLALAASVALMGAVVLALKSRSVTGSALTEFALIDLRHADEHGGKGETVGALQTALSQPSAHLAQRMPVDFAALHDTGCRTLRFKGRDVLEVCFQRNGLWFHCYIAQRADFPSLAVAAIPVIEEQGGLSSATWADAVHLYVIVSGAGREAMEKLF